MTDSTKAPDAKDTMPPSPRADPPKGFTVEDVIKPDDELDEDEELATALQNHVPDTAEEKRLVRKIDFVLLPCLWWMYVLAYLDRGNIANANAAGMSDDLQMADNDYSLLVYLFFKEIGKRFCIFYTSGCIAPALGGIMAGAIIKGLEGTRGIPGWRWLLIIEGVLTVACGFGLYFILPDYPQNARYFSSEERRLARIRILFDRQLSVHATTRRMTSWEAFKAVVCDGKTWFFLVSYSIIILGMSISYFVPTILKAMGYTNVTAQWMTVPIWITGAVCQLALSWTSDKTQDRRWHSVGLFGLAAVACLVSAVVKSAIAKYVMMCLLVAGLYTGLPLMLNWTSESIPFPDQKRLPKSGSREPTISNVSGTQCIRRLNVQEDPLLRDLYAWGTRIDNWIRTITPHPPSMDDDVDAITPAPPLSHSQGSDASSSETKITDPNASKKPSLPESSLPKDASDSEKKQKPGNTNTSGATQPKVETTNDVHPPNEPADVEKRKNL
ncbi:hypothetical protein N0V92_003032 [Colletotrichum tropicale]|nr:hypothetical protein N0V92_003032 [Colletotrichum tropicale]